MTSDLEKYAAPNPWQASPSGAAARFVSWLLIALVVVGMFTLNHFGDLIFDRPESDGPPAELMQVNIMAKMLAGQREIAPQNAGGNPTQSEQIESLNSGSLEQRLATVLLRLELDGYEPARDLMNRVEAHVDQEGYTPSESQERLRRATRQILADHRRGDLELQSVSTDDRELLKRQLGWIGQIALLPEGTSQVNARQQALDRATFSLVAGMLGCFLGGLALLAGLVGAVLFCIFFAKRKWHARFVAPAVQLVDPVDTSAGLPSQHRTVYLETFAIWMVVFVGLQFLSGLLMQSLNFDGRIGSFVSATAFFSSLVVLMWPVFRGVSFRQVRHDIGWTGNLLRETWCGVMGYISLMPAIALAFVVTIILAFLMSLFSGPQGLDGGTAPMHPIQSEIASGNPVVWLGVIVVACIAAPVVEETMFRGVFYRHLRDASSKRAVWMSVLISCIVSGFVFAIIHPQGLLGVPVLGTVATGLALAREWRDSLIAPVTMHAINNAIVTVLMMAMF